MSALPSTFRQVSTFAAIGLLATAIHYAVAVILVSSTMSAVWANPLGFISAFAVSYLGHTRLTFRVPSAERHHWRRLPRFLATAVSGFCLGQAVLVVLTSTTTLPDWLALALAIAIVPAFTFVLSRLWVFARLESGDAAPEESLVGRPASRCAEFLRVDRGPGSVYPLALILGLAAFLSLYPHPIDFILGHGGYFEVGDTPQHVTGYLFFAEDAWRWPLLVTQRIHPPEGVHIALTDSIPLAAILFKLLSPMLPENFHYFGLWHLVNKLLQAVAAVFLIRSLGQRSALAAGAAAVLALLWPAFLVRIGHTALGTHGLLLIALGLYFRSVDQTWRQPAMVASFSVLAVASLLIHPYLFAMVFPFAIAAAADRWRAGAPLANSLAGMVLVTVLVACAAVGLGYGASGSGAGGYALYSMNLLSPVCGGVLSVCTAPDATGGQYEGFNYLGAGTLLLLAGACMLRWFRPDEGRAHRHWALTVLLLGFAVYAASDAVFLGPLHLFSYRLPPGLSALSDIFRASGRFFWPVGYALLFLSLATVLKRRAVVAIPMIMSALLLQWVDTARLRADIRAATAFDHPFDYSVWGPYKGRIKHVEIVPAYGCVPIDNMHYLYFEVVAARLGATINTAYLARNDEQCDAKVMDVGHQNPDTLTILLDPVVGNALPSAIDMAVQQGLCGRWSSWGGVALCLPGTTALDWRHLQR